MTFPQTPWKVQGKEGPSSFLCCFPLHLLFGVMQVCNYSKCLGLTVIGLLWVRCLFLKQSLSPLESEQADGGGCCWQMPSEGGRMAQPQRPGAGEDPYLGETAGALTRRRDEGHWAGRKNKQPHIQHPPPLTLLLSPAAPQPLGKVKSIS